jgi:hypothetical protein
MNYLFFCSELRNVGFIDLAAEKMLIAEKENQKIAIEIKSFVGTSEVEDLKNALGQYVLYEKIIKRQLLERILYLAIRETTYNNLFSQEIGQILLEEKTLKLIIFNPEEEVITQWITRSLPPNYSSNSFPL